MFTIVGLLKMVSFSHVMHSVRENISALKSKVKTIENDEIISELSIEVSQLESRNS